MSETCRCDLWETGTICEPCYDAGKRLPEPVRVTDDEIDEVPW